MATAPLEPGALVGPYRIVRPLGEGAMGIVFEAVREPDGETVALKVLRPELSTDAVFRQRFVHEARAAGEVRHRYLVPIVDAGELDSRSYLAVEFVNGRSLEERLREGALPMRQVVRVVAHVGAGYGAEMRRDGLALASFVLAAVGGLVAAFAPLGTGTGTVGSADGPSVVQTERLSTFQVDGWWVLLVVSVPVLVALAPVLIRRRGVVVASSITLWVCCVIGVFSVGLFFIPAAVVMTIAAARAPEVGR